jgi:hypothetical protein
MNSASFFQPLAQLERTFQITDEWQGCFQLAGQRAQLAFEPEGWLVASVPVSGKGEALLRQQARMLSLAKVARGGVLRAELPVGKAMGKSFVRLRAALAEGLAVLAGTDDAIEKDATEKDEDQAALALLGDYLASGAREWSREESRFLVTLETGLFAQKIVIEPCRGGLSFQADLVRLRAPEPVSLAALVHFLLALNAGLRLARALLLPDRIALEVVLRADDLSFELVNKALGALAVGSRLAKRECAALLDTNTAQSYCEFHEERR